MPFKFDMKNWTGGKIILEAIKKNVPKSPREKKFVVWRPKTLEILQVSCLKKKVKNN